MALYDCFKCDKILYPKQVTHYWDRSDRDPATTCNTCGRNVQKREPTILDPNDRKPFMVVVVVDEDTDEIPF